MTVQELLSRVINRYQHGTIIFSKFSEITSQRVDLFELKEALVIDDSFLKNVFKTKKIAFNFSPIHCKEILEKLVDLSAIKLSFPKLFDEFSEWWSPRKKEPTKASFQDWLLNHKWSPIYRRLKTMMIMSENHRAETGINILNLAFLNIIGKVSFFGKDVPVKSPLLFIKVNVPKAAISKFEINLDLSAYDLEIYFNHVLFEFLAFANEKTLDYKELETLELNLKQIFETNLTSEEQNKIINDNLKRLNKTIFSRIFNINLSNYKESDEIHFFHFQKFLTADLNKKQFLETSNLEANIFELHTNLILGLFRIDLEGVIHDLKTLNKKDANQFFQELKELNNEKIIIDKDKVFDFKESDLLQISNLDFTQKKAILKAFNQSIIIQGPPGTGKSQTITNLLINNLWKNKSTIFSTEKKVASDVVYQKLGKNYQKFILKIDDIFSNKAIILSQLKNNIDFFIKNKPTTLTSEKIEEMLTKVNSKIDSIFAQIGEYKQFSESDEFRQYIDALQTTTSEFDPTIENELLNHSFIDKNKLHNFENIDLVYAKIRLAISAVKFVDSFKYQKIFLKYAASMDVINFEWQECRDVVNSWLYFLNKDKLLKNVSSFKVWHKSFPSSSPKNDFIEFAHYLKTLSMKEKELLLEYCGLKISNAIPLLEKINQIAKDEKNLKHLINRIFIINFEKNYFDKLRIKDQSWVEEIKDLIDQKIKIVNDVVPFFLCEERRKLIVNKAARSVSYKRLFNDCTKTIEQRKQHLNVRVFFLKYHEIILDICPILILNLSVIPFLFPLERNLVSYLVFDEASQIYLENAITAIYRAERFVIVGDEQQLQPSNFFLRTITSSLYENEEDDEEEEFFVENSSLLDYFLPRLENILLKYHYRSFYPELIQFSNKNFYNNELVFAPYLDLTTDTLLFPKNEDKKAPIFLIETKGEYHNRLNPAVAEEGIKVLKTVLQNNDNDSVGVIVFNKEQSNKFYKTLQNQDWVSDLVEENKDKHQLFIKNIEEIQGDERDIIILLIAFARNKEGKLIRNFGPISRSNGDKRINVAITRARKQLIIIKSIKSSEILTQDQDTISTGNRVFGEYLKYVEELSNSIPATQSKYKQQFLEYHKSLIQDELGTTDFEKIVGQELKKTIPSKFDIKIGIWSVGDTKFDIIIYNKVTGAFALVIECDGDTINSTLDPKERDWYRINYFLEHKWSFYWICSIDWWNPHKKKEIINDIQNILKQF